jgi:hypothetical protein
MEVREINRICWIESSSALSDKSKDQFKSGGEICFEHFVKPPVSFVIRFPKYLSLDSILIKASNVVIKINTTRRFLDKLDFGRKETILLHSAADTPNRQNESGINIYKRMATGNRIKTDRLEISFLRANAKVLSIEKLKINCQIPPALRNELDKAKPPDKTKFSYFGEYPNKTDINEANNEQNRMNSNKFDEFCMNSAAPPKNYKSVHDKNLPSWVLDSITNDVMRQPILLPSGHWVDQSTIEKWRKENLTWSRQLNDPFTGQILQPSILSSVDSIKQKQIADYFLSFN